MYVASKALLNPVISTSTSNLAMYFDKLIQSESGKVYTLIVNKRNIMVATLTSSSDVMSEQLRKRYQIPHSRIVAVWVHVGPAFQHPPSR